MMFLLQVYKAIAEIKAAEACAKQYGLTLMHDGNRDQDNLIDLCDSKYELETIARCLTVGTRFKGDTGYDDYRDNRVIVLNKLFRVLTRFNDTENKFAKLGAPLGYEAFGGHYFAARTAVIKAAAMFCVNPAGESYTNELLDIEQEIKGEAKKLEKSNCIPIADELYRVHSEAAAANLELIKKMWED